MVGFVFGPKHQRLWLILLVTISAALSCVPTEEIIWIGFSPSDRYLACATRQGRLTIYDFAEQRNREISTDVAATGGFEWAPVGERLAFCVRRKGQWDLAVADPDGSVTLLTNDEWRDLQPTWSPDGHGIYYVSSFGGGYDKDYGIRYYDLAANQSYAIIRAPHDQVEPHISPDGRWLAAVSYQHGNPVILIYALKTTRAIQIPPPPALRGGHLRLLLWLSDSRKLLYEVEQASRYHLMECEVESEKSQVLETGKQPFDSVTLDREGRNVLYVSGGKVYRRPAQPRWSGQQRLAFDGLSIAHVAVRHRDDRLGAVAEGRLLALASQSGNKVRPLWGDKDESLRWGDLELQRGHKQLGLGYYAAAMRRIREQGGADAGAEVAKVKMSRAPLLCRLGYAQATSQYLREVEQALGKMMDEETRDRLCALSALNEFVGNDNSPAARAWIEKIAPEKRSTETALLLQILNHPDKSVRRDYRRGLAALWQQKLKNGADIFQQLLQSHPKDPVVQAAYDWALKDLLDSPLSDVFEAARNPDERLQTYARMIVRYYEIVGNPPGKDLDLLAAALMVLRDTDGLKRVVLQSGQRLMRRDAVLELYGRYWHGETLSGDDNPAWNEALDRVYFDPEVLARVIEKTTDSLVLTAVRLALARHALVAGDLDEMKRAVADLEKGLARPESNREAAIAYAILQGELNERLDVWDKAIQHYREATGEIEKRLKDKKTDENAAKYLSRLSPTAQFRADLLDRGKAVKGDLSDLLLVERGVGDYLMTDSTDPTSLLNGIHNYFSLLGQMSTPWVKDVVFLKAGQCYRRLGRWCEAGFCLRVAARSSERFVARYARAELADLYRGLEDPGLAAR